MSSPPPFLTKASSCCILATFFIFFMAMVMTQSSCLTLPGKSPAAHEGSHGPCLQPSKNQGRLLDLEPSVAYVEFLERNFHVGRTARGGPPLLHDAKYESEKRLVPSEPNPLHN